jgi:hypothetical protein
MGYAYVTKRPVYFLGALYVLGKSQFQNTSKSQFPSSKIPLHHVLDTNSVAYFHSYFHCAVTIKINTKICTVIDVLNSNAHPPIFPQNMPSLHLLPQTHAHCGRISEDSCR